MTSKAPSDRLKIYLMPWEIAGEHHHETYVRRCLGGDENIIWDQHVYCRVQPGTRDIEWFDEAGLGRSYHNKEQAMKACDERLSRGDENAEYILLSEEKASKMRMIL